MYANVTGNDEVHVRLRDLRISDSVAISDDGDVAGGVLFGGQAVTLEMVSIVNCTSRAREDMVCRAQRPPRICPALPMPPCCVRRPATHPRTPVYA